MKKTLFAAIAVAGLGLGLAGTASAASYRDAGISNKERNIEVRVDRGLRNGALTRSEATYLRGQLNGVKRLEMRYSRNGFNRAERLDLNRRLDMVSAHVFNQRHDAQRRW
jgi:hypothetical protein